VSLILVLSLLLLVLGSVLRKKNKRDREFQSPFECGFSTFQDYRLKFRLHFFLVALVFIIFDVELILLFPFYRENLRLKSLRAILVFIIFLFILTLGLVNE
jgi:NADH:ubiquinone oxidoreductase subunit 3 (subunit A)